MVANRSAQHGITCFERIEHCALRALRSNVQRHFAAYAGQRSQMCGQDNSNHRSLTNLAAASVQHNYSVCTSTENTAGRSLTIAAHVSPPSDDPYTCPPVVPKYSPQGSSESTAMASRKTLT